MPSHRLPIISTSVSSDLHRGQERIGNSGLLAQVNAEAIIKEPVAIRSSSFPYRSGDIVASQKT
jgi:hypothetical protein